ncbi:MAG: glycosyltransferase, partial [Cytophagales bacterium]|nr:glycosyltransferase [Cytophagales bacterium]
MTCPICLFTYKRLWHTKRCIKSLLKNPESAHTKLYIFSDAPKSEKDQEAVKQVRAYIRDIKGFAELEVIEQATNQGLAQSVIQGVSYLLKKYEGLIIVEDDLEVSPSFLNYMNAGLLQYKDDPRVVSIHGYVYPCAQPLPAFFFLRGADCWGWATWPRAWELFEQDGAVLKRKLLDQNLVRAFDFDRNYPFYKILEDQIKGLN